jgi:hypothetical protein
MKACRRRRKPAHAGGQRPQAPHPALHPTPALLPPQWRLPLIDGNRLLHLPCCFLAGAWARNTELGAALGVGVGRRVGPCVGWSDSAGMRLGKRLGQFVDAGEGFLKCRRAGS